MRAGRVHRADDPALAMAADKVVQFHRFFGDWDGDRDVDASDKATFLGAVGSMTPMYLPAFDFDGDGDIDAADQAQFNKRFGRRI